MSKKKVYSICAEVHGSKWLGNFEANSPEEAIEMAITKNGHVSLCHQCNSECEDPEIGDCTAWLTDENPSSNEVDE